MTATRTNEVRTMTLAEILDERQMKDVESIIHQIRTGTTQLDSLRFYLRTQEKELAVKEVDPNYLFYAVCYAAKLF